MSNDKSIVLLGVQVDLFKSCFVATESLWAPYELIVLDESISSSKLSATLQKSGVCSVVFQDTDLDGSLLVTLKEYYDEGGLVVFFGIYGVYDDPSKLSVQFDLPKPWEFSAYTRYEYEITNIAMDCLGYKDMKAQRLKCNLLHVPIQDRWLVPKATPLHQFIEDHLGSLQIGEEPDDEWKRDVPKAKESYLEYCEGLYRQCPLAVHQNANEGQLAYLGFVNGDGDVERVVNCVLTRNDEHENPTNAGMGMGFMSFLR